MATISGAFSVHKVEGRCAVKDYDPFLLSKGVTFAKNWLTEQGATSMEFNERTTIGKLASMKTGIYSIPRDHSNDPHELAMIHKDKHYKAAESFFSKKGIVRRYIVLSRTLRSGTEYDAHHSRFMLIPEHTFKMVFNKQVTLNIGTSMNSISRFFT